MNEFALRREMVEVGQWMYDKDLVAASDGNLSVRLGPNEFLITPAGSCLGRLKAKDLVIIDGEGKSVGSSARPTSESRLHLEVYRLRADVAAVVHAHPPLCTAFSVAGVGLAECVLPEVAFTLGAIPTTDYATPTTDEPPRVIREFIGQCDAMILDRHGTLTVGSSLRDAFFKLDKLEHTAKVVLAAKILGKVQVLSSPQVEKLLAARATLGLTGKQIRCVHCTTNSCSPETGDDLVKTISSEVLKILGK